MKERKARRANEAGKSTNCKDEIQTTNTFNHNSIDLASIADKLNGIRNGGGYLCHCPAHEDGRRSLSLKTSDDGRLLAHCFAGCEFKDIIREIEGITGGARRYVAPAVACVDSSKFERLRDTIWSEALPVKPGDPVHTYLTQTRRLPLATIPIDLQIHPTLAYYEHDGNRSIKVGEYPAMVAAVRDVNGVLLTLHRTYLTPDGRKLSDADPSKTTRKLMPGIDATGGAIRLGDAGEELVIAEGIETALAASVLSGLPSWAAISASGLERVIVPKGVERVVICVDNDPAGIRHSKRFALRLSKQGVEPFLANPIVAHHSSNDWADLFELEVA